MGEATAEVKGQIGVGISGVFIIIGGNDGDGGVGFVVGRHFLQKVWDSSPWITSVGLLLPQGRAIGNGRDSWPISS